MVAVDVAVAVGLALELVAARAERAVAMERASERAREGGAVHFGAFFVGRAAAGIVVLELVEGEVCVAVLGLELGRRGGARALLMGRKFEVKSLHCRVASVEAVDGELLLMVGIRR